MHVCRTARCLLALAFVAASLSAQNSAPTLPSQLAGFRNFPATQAKWDKLFLSAPSAQLAGEHLKTLTLAPHPAGSAEDRKTAEYVAQKFRDAGLETEIVPYKVVLAFPRRSSLRYWAATAIA